jgi:hypothetical protein
MVFLSVCMVFLSIFDGCFAKKIKNHESDRSSLNTAPIPPKLVSKDAQFQIYSPLPPSHCHHTYPPPQLTSNAQRKIKQFKQKINFLNIYIYTNSHNSLNTAPIPPKLVSKDAQFQIYSPLPPSHCHPHIPTAASHVKRPAQVKTIQTKNQNFKYIYIFTNSHNSANTAPNTIKLVSKDAQFQIYSPLPPSHCHPHIPTAAAHVKRPALDDLPPVLRRNSDDQPLHVASLEPRRHLRQNLRFV